MRQIARDKYGLSDITIVYDGQKPRLLNNEFYFSISHSKNLLVLAVNDKSVGVDVEYVDSKRSFKKIIKRFSENVRSEFFNLPEEKRLEYFFEIWTNYEALIKLRGKTLATCDFNPKECGVLFENKRFEKDYILSVATSH